MAASSFLHRFDPSERAQAMLDRLKGKDLVLDAAVVGSAIATESVYGYMEGRLGEEKLTFFQSVKTDPDTGEELTTTDADGNTVKMLDADSGVSGAFLGGLALTIGSAFMRGPREPGGSEAPLFMGAAGGALLGLCGYKYFKKMGADQKAHADKAASKGEEDYEPREHGHAGAQARYHRPRPASLGEGSRSVSSAEVRAAEAVRVR